MKSQQKGFDVVFFKNANGNQPVREFIQGLERNKQKELGADIRVIQNSFPVGLPLVKKLKSELWEIRSITKDGVIRVFFTFLNEKIILLHAFTKKSQKTPLQEIDTAIKRLKEFRKLQQ